ncbi:type VI secretion system-associated protein TagO [Bartonella sp. LJL80]
MADDTVLGQEGKKCIEITDRVQRLLCFDDVYKSPVAKVEPIAVENTTKIVTGPMRSMAETLERQRVAGDMKWITRARPWQETMLLTEDDYMRILNARSNREPADDNSAKLEWTAQTVDIFMTMKEADVPADRPQADEAIMMLSCENDITTLAVLLPKPIMTLQANLSLSSGNGSIFKLNWRDVENGTVVIAGRGLESIASIKTISNYARVQLQVNYPEGPRAFIFDMNDLKDRLKPLRLACHW